MCVTYEPPKVCSVLRPHKESNFKDHVMINGLLVRNVPLIQQWLFLSVCYSKECERGVHSISGRCLSIISFPRCLALPELSDPITRCALIAPPNPVRARMGVCVCVCVCHATFLRKYYTELNISFTDRYNCYNYRFK
jgi:hypothetical protein